MVKQDSTGRFYAAADPQKTFATEGEAHIHQSVVRRRGEGTRPDSRDVRTRMADDGFTVPLAEKSERFAALEASLKQSTDKGYSASMTTEQRLLHSIKVMRDRDQDEADAADAQREWLVRPIVQAGLAECNRILAECADDFTRDRAEIVAAEKLVKCLTTPGACLTHINAELRNLLGVEAGRIAAAQQAANAELNAAQAKVSQLQASQRATVKVPVEGATLAERGSSLVTNLMSANASHNQIDDVFVALNKYHEGDPSHLEAALQANDAEAAA